MLGSIARSSSGQKLVVSHAIPVKAALVAEKMRRYRGAFEMAEVLLSKEEDDGY